MSQIALPNFESLKLDECLLSAVQRLGFNQATEIQMKAIPVALEGRDVMACAQTGSGKTAAFCLPMISRLLRDPQLKALIMAPTRELAAQIHDVIQDLSEKIPGIRSSLLIGGTSMMPQLRSLKKNPNVLIATPGRLVDHLKRKSVSLNEARYVVLDECDRMLDMGFAPQIREVLKFTPSNRQTLLFSATFPEHMMKLALGHLKNPIRVGVVQSAATVPSRIQQAVVHTTGQEKGHALVKELNTRIGSVVIFARTKSRTDRLAKFLMQSGFQVRRIHGDRSQRQRQEALEDFKNGTARVLVATDIAARGIDGELDGKVNIEQSLIHFVHNEFGIAAIAVGES